MFFVLMPRPRPRPRFSELGSYPRTALFSFATVSDEQLDRELRTSAREDGVYAAQVSAAALCITESRSAFGCPGFQGVLETPQRCAVSRMTHGLGLQDLASHKPGCRLSHWVSETRQRHAQQWP